MAVAAPAFAQSAPRVELSGGYQFVNFSLDGNSESMGKGWYADVVGNLNPVFGIVFQVGGNYKTFEESATIAGITATATADLKVHQFLGGVRLHARSDSSIVPFAQVAAGAINGSIEVTASTTIPGASPITFSNEDSGTNVGLAVGGGANIDLGGNIGLRVAADYLRVFQDDGGANVFRFQAGVVIGR